MASDKIIVLTDDNFAEKIKTENLPIVIDFWATWCGPCKAVAPAIDQLADEMDGQIKFAKVNIEESPNVAGEYGIMSVPTFVILKNGEKVGAITGALAKSKLKAKIEEILA